MRRLSCCRVASLALLHPLRTVPTVSVQHILAVGIFARSLARSSVLQCREVGVLQTIVKSLYFLLPQWALPFRYTARRARSHIRVLLFLYLFLSLLLSFSKSIFVRIYTPGKMTLNLSSLSSFVFVITVIFVIFLLSGLVPEDFPFLPVPRPGVQE